MNFFPEDAGGHPRRSGVTLKPGFIFEITFAFLSFSSASEKDIPNSNTLIDSILKFGRQHGFVNKNL